MRAYLDNAATAPPTEGVIREMARSLREGFFNPSSNYGPALAVERELRAFREELAAAANAPRHKILFTSGGTEANNLAILGAVGAMRGTVGAVTFATEHPSVLEPYKELARRGHRAAVLPVGADGLPVWDELIRALEAHEPKPALVSFMLANNETGAVPDAPRIIEAVRRRSPESLIHVDGVQGFMRVPFRAADVDLFTVSAHKLHGPKGVGALIYREGVRLAPLRFGGGQEGGLRSGTENTPGIAGFRQAVRELRAIPNLASDLREKKHLLNSLILEAIPEAAVNGPPPEGGAPHILSLSLPPVAGEVLMRALEGEGVICSTGAACSSKRGAVSPTLAAMGLPRARSGSALRLSLSPHTAEGEIRFAAEAIVAQYRRLRRYGGR